MHSIRLTPHRGISYAFHRAGTDEHGRGIEALCMERIGDGEIMQSIWNVDMP